MIKIQPNRAGLFLISAKGYIEAEQKAQELNLPSRQWKYVPSQSSRFRWPIIEKYRGKIPQEHLIGEFDFDEILYLSA